MKETAFPLAAPYASVQCKGLSAWDYFFAAALAGGATPELAEEYANDTMEIRSTRTEVVKVNEQVAQDLVLKLGRFLNVMAPIVVYESHKNLYVEACDIVVKFRKEIENE